MVLLYNLSVILIIWTLISRNAGSKVYTASYNGDLDEVRQLTAKNCADVNTPYEGGDGKNTPLHVAAKINHTQIVMLLLSCNADPDKKAADGLTALMFASQIGTVDVANILLGAGAGIDIKQETGWTALMLASYNMRTKIGKALVNAEAKLDLQQKDGRTALMMASNNNHLSAVEVLISAGADTNIQQEIGWTALIFSVNRGHLAVTKELVESGANLNIKTHKGETALHKAAEKNRKEEIGIFLQHGADVSIETNAGETAESISRKNGFADLLKLIQQYTDAKGHVVADITLEEQLIDISAKSLLMHVIYLMMIGILFIGMIAFCCYIYKLRKRNKQLSLQIHMVTFNNKERRENEHIYDDADENIYDEAKDYIHEN
ncbi:unnamed protein product [Meganyctiphanes norvegica]|uniref:Ankyrin repeat domain-containing protein n=1 Tax=Meganyctiphanes norvegica TaxID=48144 RepID=A0AAV2R0R9_MEGNR